MRLMSTKKNKNISRIRRGHLFSSEARAAFYDRNCIIIIICYGGGCMFAKKFNFFHMNNTTHTISVPVTMPALMMAPPPQPPTRDRASRRRAGVSQVKDIENGNFLISRTQTHPHRERVAFQIKSESADTHLQYIFQWTNCH